MTPAFTTKLEDDINLHSACVCATCKEKARAQAVGCWWGDGGTFTLDRYTFAFVGVEEVRYLIRQVQLC